MKKKSVNAYGAYPEQDLEFYKPDLTNHEDIKAELSATAPSTLEISPKAIIMAIAVIMVLVIAAIILAYTLPMGAYDRVLDADGHAEIVDGSFEVDSSLSRIAWWKILLSPIMILNPADSGAVTVWAILLLLLVIGAIFTALDATGIMVYMVGALRERFKTKKYVLLFVMPFVFMFLGSTAGMFEELIPLVPVVVLLCYAFNWDALVGLAISILATCFGFAAGVVNPFTVGIANQLVGLPMFDGILLRLLTFVVAYVVLMAFVFPYAKRIDKNPKKSPCYADDMKKKQDYDYSKVEFVYEPKKGKALKWFAAWMLVVVAFAVLSIFISGEYIPALGDFQLANYVLYVTVAIYVIAGIGACILCGLTGKALLKKLGKGAVTLAPAVIMILIAGGIRYIIDEGNVMDTILYYLINACNTIQTGSTGGTAAVVLLIIYLMIFIFEMFIPSGSAKAFLLMPMVGELCSQVGVSKYAAVLAFAFGDGFANVILPTNAGLLLILGLTTVTYPKWFRWSGKIQGAMFICTIGILMLAEFVVYAV